MAENGTVTSLSVNETNTYLIASVQNMLAVNAVLIDMYTAAWENCSNAANETGIAGYGLLDDYYLLAEILLGYQNGTGILPIEDGLATWESGDDDRLIRSK